MRKEFRIILALSASFLGLTALSGCTKDDVKSLQEQVTDLQTELDNLKAQIAALQSQLKSDIQGVKDDYNAKIATAESKISALETELNTLKEDFENSKKEITDDYNAKIAALGTKHDTDKQALEDDYNTKINSLTSTYEAKVASIEEEISSLNTEISNLKDEMNAKIQQIQSDYNDKIDALTNRVTTIENTDPHNLLTGHGIPGETLGVNGDSYINLDNWDYYTKADGVWTLSGNMRGGQGDKGDSATTYIPCIFNNYDGTKLYEFYYEKGSTIVYDGPTPTKPSETIDGKEYAYTFTGWDKSLENIQEPTIFTAQFEGPETCTFKNYDGTILYTTTVSYGESVTYAGVTPTKPDTTSGDKTFVWTFTGWDKSLDRITEDTIFTAQFYAPNAIKCTFNDYDGTELYVGYCGQGDTITYGGATPSRATNDDGNGTVLSYAYTGWDKTLKNITEDTVFTAQYEETTSYWCTFTDYNGDVLQKTLVEKGKDVTFNGDTPTRNQEVSGSMVTEYAFSGWDNELSNISAPTTFKAQYSVNTFAGHKVTFKNGDVILYSHYFKDGTTATYPNEMPYSYDKTNVTMFLGWDKSLKNISEDLEVSAVFKTITRHQNGEYPQTKVTDATLFANIQAANVKDNQGYYVYDDESYCLYNGNFYKVEPIKWKFLKNEDGKYMAVSETILDYHTYHSTTSKDSDGNNANNYSKSSIRSWLNDTFLNKAFAYDDSLLETTLVDNSAATTGNPNNQYACENTSDKVFLLSRQDLVNGDYGFSSDAARQAKVSDYASALGVKEGYYWTRSPYHFYATYAHYISTTGGITYTAVTGSYPGVRPAVTLNLS